MTLPASVQPKFIRSERAFGASMQRASLLRFAAVETFFIRDRRSGLAIVTVGIPFFNDRSTLANAIRSVLAQTFTDFELLLVDDGSTDGSLDLARLVSDPRV